MKVLTINLLVPFKPSKNSWRAALSFLLASMPFFFPLFPFPPFFFFFFFPERCFFFASLAFVAAGIFGPFGSSSAVESRLRRDGKT